MTRERSGDYTRCRVAGDAITRVTMLLLRCLIRTLFRRVIDDKRYDIADDDADYEHGAMIISGIIRRDISILSATPAKIR